ncbi:MAG TPA: hypothetical protein VF678_16585 [bacterium]
MKRLLRILVLHSIRDLVRYKSFFVLVAALIVLDRALHGWLPVDFRAMGIPPMRELMRNTSVFLFNEAPGIALRVMTDYRALATVAVLFALKELVSLWPSSDMRRMHRGERERSGVLASLTILRWHQVAWDACAAGSLVAITGLWCCAWYALFRQLWISAPANVWLLLWLAAAGLSAPVFLAGMSYSSKLAVITQGTFREKLWLFYRLFLDWGVFWRSWVLFAIRIAIEGLFVAAVPLGAFLTIDNFWLRIVIASVFAAPAYSYVKMASFKFFLEVYRKFPRVQDEFRRYYETFQL